MYPYKYQLYEHMFGVFFLQAACIWLLTLVKKCGQHTVIQERLSRLQSAFMGMLSENDGEHSVVFLFFH